MNLFKKDTVNVEALVKWAGEQKIPVIGQRRVHLVLAGGGVRLFALLFAAFILHLAGFIFTRITGTSAGAVSGSILAAKYSANASREDRGKAIIEAMIVALEVDIPRLLDPTWFFWRIAFKLVGLIKGKKILKKFRKELPATFDELKTPFAAAAFQVNIGDPRTVMLEDGDLPLAVRASMCIPYVFSPVRRDSMLLLDGGWQMNLPLPRGGENVVALTFSTGEDERVEEVENNLELGFKLVEGAIAEGMRRAVDSAPMAKVIDLETRLTTLDFFASSKKKTEGMIDSAESVLAWLKGQES